MAIKFESLTELYKRVRPALTIKKLELKRLGFNYIKEEDIWNFFKETKWGRASNLSLSEMVNDILNCDNYQIDFYSQEKIADLPRTINIEED